MVSYGNCVDCDFPVMLQGDNPVSCPSCSTVNQPITQGPLLVIEVPLIFVIGAVAIALIAGGDKVRKKAKGIAKDYLIP